MEMGRRVLVGRLIAASDVTAGSTDAKMQPPGTGLQTFLATTGAGGDLVDRRHMGAFVHLRVLVSSGLHIVDRGHGRETPTDDGCSIDMTERPQWGSGNLALPVLGDSRAHVCTDPRPNAPGRMLGRRAFSIDEAPAVLQDRLGRRPIRPPSAI
jgi:hypothetical protein